MCTNRVLTQARAAPALSLQAPVLATAAGVILQECPIQRHPSRGNVAKMMPRRGAGHFKGRLY
jgi:hypothetical protein